MKTLIGNFALTSVIIFLTGGLYLTSSYAQGKQNGTRKYIKMEVNGLACPFCAYGLEKKLKSIKGADGFYIDIKDGYAFLNVPPDTKVTKEELEKIVSDAGFELKSAKFSDRPFKQDKD